MQDIVKADAPLALGNMVGGFDALVLADAARLAGGRLVFIATDGKRLDAVAQAVAFFAPDLPVLTLPAWDCLPYDRLSPQTSICAARMATLSRLPDYAGRAHLVLTTIAAATQKLPPPMQIGALAQDLRPGQHCDIAALTAFLTANGYMRVARVVEAGAFAVRGGIIDIFPSGEGAPVRLDMFGDTLESLRRFDPETQLSTAQLDHLRLLAAGEVHLDAAAIKRFRAGYLRAFGAAGGRDPLYDAISQATRHQGMEHYAPLFYDDLVDIFAHCDSENGTLYFSDYQLEDAAESRHALVADYYAARLAARELAEKNEQWAMNPLPPDQLYIPPPQFFAALAARHPRTLSPFPLPEGDNARNLDAEAARNFAPIRAQQDADLFAAVAAHIKELQASGQQVILACWSDGSRARLIDLLADAVQAVEDWQAAQNCGAPAAICLPLANGFTAGRLSVMSEADILGARMGRRRKRRAENFLTEATSLTPGEYIVHVEHGIGRFDGLQTMEVAGAPHDFLKLIYHENSRLYLPVENIDLLSRYGGEASDIRLDQLGGGAWQKRHAKLKKRLRDMAGALIKTAAARATQAAEKYLPLDGAYETFCARFGHDETEDQAAAIAAVMDDLARGRPMDRLICGDVGFGKTEIALRAACVVALGGAQVALIAPTTLLANQHARQFRTRFADFPVRIGELSRLVAPREAAETRAQLADGALDIVIGTHALLAKQVRFKRLGLMVVDEEQHFGVAHKERLKNLRVGVHVLTLTATPIPRTLQLALSGVRDLSLIATPPVDRLAVRSFISPFDEVNIREALLREKYRGGQSFVIVPRIADIEQMTQFLTAFTPELSFVTAHGQMAGRELETRMAAFYSGEYDALLSTSIVESGLDIPSANTIIIHRADRFGLAQLYQLRGRVGRAKQRAFAYLTHSANKPLSAAAESRLKIMQSLDSLGAGFTLASHDLDLRGAGNLLGEEQSGHIREVGFELYQSMLEDAVAEAQGKTRETTWSPQINIGAAVLIPEDYVPDLELRLGLYRRLADLEDAAAIEAIASEMIDRFGALPQEVTHLLDIIQIKLFCRRAGIAKIEAGEKGATLHFRNDRFAAPERLVALIDEHKTRMKLRPDHGLVIRGDWQSLDARRRGVRKFAAAIAELVTAA